jgi:hypothetical protein
MALDESLTSLAPHGSSSFWFGGETCWMNSVQVDVTAMPANGWRGVFGSSAAAPPSAVQAIPGLRRPVQFNK